MNCSTPSTLILISCSDRKFDDPIDMPVLLRYDGPVFRTLRAHLRSLGGFPKDHVKNIDTLLASIPPWMLIYPVSMRYGVIPHTEIVPYYDHHYRPVDKRLLSKQAILAFKKIAEEYPGLQKAMYIGPKDKQGYLVSFGPKIFSAAGMACSWEYICGYKIGVSMQMLVEWLEKTWRENAENDDSESIGH